jgi:hypothetical protein
MFVFPPVILLVGAACNDESDITPFLGGWSVDETRRTIFPVGAQPCTRHHIDHWSRCTRSSRGNSSNLRWRFDFRQVVVAWLMNLFQPHFFAGYGHAQKYVLGVLWSGVSHACDGDCPRPTRCCGSCLWLRLVPCQPSPRRKCN